MARGRRLIAALVAASAVAGAAGAPDYQGAARSLDHVILEEYAYVNNDPLNLTDPSGLSPAESASGNNSLIQQAQFIPLLETPPVEIFPRVPTTPLDQLPGGSAGGPGAGARFPRALNEQNRQQNPNCYLCDRPTTDQPGPDQYNGDHIVPRAQGGNNSPDNLGTTCRTCNLQKGNQTPQQYVPKFYFDPIRGFVPLTGGGA